ncbi:hypothetical protein ECZU24_58250 [Escherichia coli]|nr:hypothetical protein ECZU24_58250 [Escherichia coli]
MEGETAKSERVNDRKITADGKEGPGDRSGEAYLCIPPTEARLRWRHGTATHDTMASYLKTHKAMPAWPEPPADVLIPARAGSTPHDLQTTPGTKRS